MAIGRVRANDRKGIAFMDQRTNLELEPLALSCVACHGPIMHALPPPFRVHLAAVDSKYRISSSRRDGNVARIVGGDHCGSCKVRALDDVAIRDAIGAELTDLERVRTELELTEFLATFQRFDWVVTDQHRELRGGSLVSYGLWCELPEPLPELGMRSMTFNLPGDVVFSILFPLEVLTLPGMAATVRSRWDPSSGRQWRELDGLADADRAGELLMLAAMSLTWDDRRPGRPYGSTDVSLKDVELCARSLWSESHRQPTQRDVARKLRVSTDTLQRTVQRATGMPWPAFIRTVRDA